MGYLYMDYCIWSFILFANPVSHVSFYLISKALWVVCPHFKDEETQAQKDWKSAQIVHIADKIGSQD